MKIENAEHAQTSMPQENYIRTANKTGFSTRYLDPIAKKGIAFAKGKTLPILDIGCGYGAVSRALLAQGNSVVANDSSLEHLENLKSSLPEDQKKYLTLRPGMFPEAFEPQPQSLSAGIAIWVLHFLSGEGLKLAAEKLFLALEQGGCVFISASSAYVKFLGNFIPLYHDRIEKKDPFPGWVEDVKLYLQPHQLENLPRSMHFLDPTVLTRIFSAAGFEVEYAGFFKRDDVTEGMYLDGRENVGLIARKPGF
jgi:SAM-dependent methyltransferase